MRLGACPGACINRRLMNEAMATMAQKAMNAIV